MPPSSPHYEQTLICYSKRCTENTTSKATLTKHMLRHASHAVTPQQFRAVSPTPFSSARLDIRIGPVEVRQARLATFRLRQTTQLHTTAHRSALLLQFRSFLGFT